MRIETTHCDACDTTNIGCLVSQVAGETVLAICPFCVTDDELDSLTEQRLSLLYRRDWCGAPQATTPALATLFLGTWF